MKYDVLDCNNDLSLALSEEIKNINAQIDELTEKKKAMSEAILSAMEENGIKKFENDYMTITYVAPTTKETLDSKRLKSELETIYNKYIKISNVKSSVRITIKK